MRAIAGKLDNSIVRGLGTTLVFAGLTAVLAQVAFRLPGTPVPVTFQVLGVALSGLLLGSRLGALAQFEYLLAGLAGAPVFAGWSGGPTAIVGPSGGYIPGFVLGALVTGAIFERCRRQDAPRAFAAGMAGVAAIYLCGVAWLSVWLRIGGGIWHGLPAWLLGVAPFVGVDALKVTVAAMIATGASRWRR